MTRAVSKAKKYLLWIVGAMAVAVAARVVYNVNPEGAVWMPKCAVHALTGYQCPTCGATRAAHAAMHGDFAGAFMFNPMMPVFLVLAAAIIFRCCTEDNRNHLISTTALVYTFLALYIIWGIIRNIIGV